MRLAPRLPVVADHNRTSTRRRGKWKRKFRIRQKQIFFRSKTNRMISAARVDRVKLFANVQSALASIGRPVCAAA
jgi:hypothetical protein